MIHDVRINKGLLNYTTYNAAKLIALDIPTSKSKKKTNAVREKLNAFIFLLRCVQLAPLYKPKTAPYNNN